MARVVILIVVIAGCGTEDLVTEDAGEGLEGTVALVPATDVSATDVVGDPEAEALFDNVDDGPSGSFADDGASTVSSRPGAVGAAHVTGYAGAPAGRVTDVVVHTRGAGKGTLQVNLSDGTTRLGQGAPRRLTTGFRSQRTEFHGLDVADAGTLRTEVVLSSASRRASLAPRYTQIWIDVTLAPTCTPTSCEAEEACGEIDDGCGGVLECAPCADPVTCGDGACGDDESCRSCAIDCGACAAEVACTIFVSPGGQDGAAGSETAPLRRIQEAADRAVAGDTICLREGVYEEGAFLRRSGEPDAPITLRNAPGETAVVHRGIGISTAWGVEIGWVVVEGLVIRELPCCGEAIWVHSAHDIVIRGNRLEDNYGQGMLGDALRVRIDGNVIARNGLTGDLPGLSNYHTHGIYMTGGDYVIVNNLIVGNQGYGIQVAGYPWDPEDPNHPAGPEYKGASGWLIANNVFASSLNRGAIVVWQPDARDNTIQNNIFYDNATSEASDTQGIDFYHCGSGNVVRNNLFFSHAGKQAIADTSDGESYTETGRVEGDPLFVAPDALDFHLSVGSPAVDAGWADGAPDRDFDGNARPAGQGVDLGAFER